MTTPWREFTGPSYLLANEYASVERSVNWYTITNETGEEKKYRSILEPCPGNGEFCTLPVPNPFNQPNRGLIECRDRVFGVNGTVVFAIDNTGAFTNLGTVSNINGNAPVSMAANGNGQIFLASDGFGYVINVASGMLTAVPTSAAGFLGASYVTFQDGYIIVATPGLNQFQISGTAAIPLGDATQWDASNIGVLAGQADNLSALISGREYLRLLGERRSQIFQDVGNTGGQFPFSNYNETFIETGIGAPFSLCELGDSHVWIGQDARGQRAMWRDVLSTPQRVSNYAVEQAWAGYSTISDAIAFPMIWEGHTQVQITFPTANRTWVWDVTESELQRRAIWFERNFTTSSGFQHARPERYHCFAFGKHLVGSVGTDGNPGAIYQYFVNPLPGKNYDCGLNQDGTQGQLPIVRDRIAPHLNENFFRTVHNRLMIECSRGVGLSGAGVGTDPHLLLRCSDDGGENYGPELLMTVGQIGQFTTRVYANRLGYARDRVYWLRYADPTYMGLIGAYLDSWVCGS